MTRSLTFADRDPGIHTRTRISPVAVPSEDIVAWLDARAPTPIDNWDDIGPEEYTRGFVVAKTAGYDVIGDLYEGLQEVFRDTGGAEDFAERVEPIMRAKGWLADENSADMSRRLRLIFDTNLRVSRATGQWERIQRTKGLMPYLAYSATLDRRVRPHHAAWHGVVLPVDHPAWRTHFPPCGFRCRCDVRQLSRSQALRMGGVTSEAKVQELLAQHPADPGWGYNPGVEYERAQLEKVRETNDRRLPDAEPINFAPLAQAAQALWDRIFGGSDVTFAYNPLQARDALGRWLALLTPNQKRRHHKRRIRRLVREAVSHKSRQKRIDLGPVDAADIQLRAGRTLHGYSRTIGTEDVRHVMKKHGDPVVERARGQVAVTRRDFERIPDIIEGAHSLKAIGRPGSGKLERLVYEARVGGYNYTYIEEIRPKSRVVALKTFFKAQ